MSPFLLLLIAEALNHLVKQALDSGTFQGIYIVGCEFMIHILFFDGILLFGAASEENAIKYLRFFTSFKRLLEC